MSFKDFSEIAKDASRHEVVDREHYELIIDKMLRENRFLKSLIGSDMLNHIISIIKKEYSKISEVKNVFGNFNINSNSVEIVTIVKNLSREVQRKIYSIEYELLNRFKEYIFDFTIFLESKELVLSDYYKKIL